jgi:Tol biopolymer transport system component
VGIKAGDTTIVPLVATAATEFFPSLSPDGRWLAYASNESGALEVYVRPFPTTATARWQVSTAGGGEPVWAHNGRELFYISGKGDMVAAEIRPGAVLSVGAQHVLFSLAPFVRSGSFPSYAVAPDDNRFLLVREGDASQQGELVIAQSWAGELSRREGR